MSLPINNQVNLEKGKKKLIKLDRINMKNKINPLLLILLNLKSLKFPNKNLQTAEKG
jgi:hypothetical protein